MLGQKGVSSPFNLCGRLGKAAEHSARCVRFPGGGPEVLSYETSTSARPDPARSALATARLASISPTSRVSPTSPNAIDFEAAAPMMLNGLTARFLLRRTFRVREGDTVLVHAAAGAVGTILPEWPKHLGATVMAGSARPRGSSSRTSTAAITSSTTASVAVNSLGPFTPRWLGLSRCQTESVDAQESAPTGKTFAPQPLRAVRRKPNQRERDNEFVICCRSTGAAHGWQNSFLAGPFGGYERVNCFGGSSR